MCGIVGVFDLKKACGPETLARLVDTMRDTMVHRGPDDQASWVDPDGVAAFGHRRLSIIDLSPEGRQPMSADGVDAVVTFNGEIYNFQELRDRLIAQGHTFNSRSDTEVLPYLFRDLDASHLARLNGMYALAVWEPKARTLLLARDPFGKKPLYIYEDQDFFAFASEMQAFYALPSFKADIDRDALAEYLMLGYLPGPRTIYKNVRMAAPGGFEKISFAAPGERARTIDSGKFFRFSAQTRASVSQIDKRALKDRLRHQLIRAVERRMVADVPLGAFLSGGVDSALVVSIVRRELDREINTYSIGFEGSDESEHEAAREIANRLGARHHDEMLQPDGIDLIHKIAGVLDQPNGDSSCLPTFLLSEFTRRHVTVALSGDGGDELFGGYGRYRDTLNELADPQLLRRNHPHLDPKKATPADLYFSMRWHIWLPDQATKLLGAMPAAAKARIDEWRAVLNDPSEPVLHRMRTIDAALYMPGGVLAKVDRMSMQHSLEVRCPMLDVEFAETAMGLSEDDCWAGPATTKKILKEIAFDYLPEAWMTRSKKGFGLPANAWAQNDVIELAKNSLGAAGSRTSTLFDPTALAAMIGHQQQPGCFSIYQLWPLIILELWLRAQEEKIAGLRNASRLVA
ncbi:MAG: asparagine synthase (glutamine-hydrolyzing) [Pseudomonadota bacterium]